MAMKYEMYVISVCYMSCLLTCTTAKNCFKTQKKNNTWNFLKITFKKMCTFYILCKAEINGKQDFINSAIGNIYSKINQVTDSWLPEALLGCESFL